MAPRRRRQTGASAGALTATLAACDVDLRVRARRSGASAAQADAAGRHTRRHARALRDTAFVMLRRARAQASVDLAYGLTLEKDLYNRPGGLAGARRWCTLCLAPCAHFAVSRSPLHSHCAGVWGPLIRRWLDELLPADAARVCSGRVGLFTLALWPPLPRHVFVDDFASKEDLIDAAMASVHIPWFLDGRFRRVAPRASAQGA